MTHKETKTPDIRQDFQDIVKSIDKKILISQQRIEEIKSMSEEELADNAQSEYDMLEKCLADGRLASSVFYPYQHDYQAMLDDLKLLSSQDWKESSIDKQTARMVFHLSMKNSILQMLSSDNPAEVVSITSHPKFGS